MPTDRDLTDMKASSMEPGGAVDEYTKHDKSHHNDFPPWFVKPVANQFWLPEELGGGSSLSLNPSTRVASTNDLVLDLVVVYILNQIVSIVGTSTIVPLTPANGTVTPDGPQPEPAAQFNSSWNQFNSIIEGPVANLASIFVNAISVFIPVWTNWYRTAVLLNRFEASDMVNYGIFFINIVLMLFAGRGVQAYMRACACMEGTENKNSFLYALVVWETWQVAWCLYLVYHNPKHARALTGLIFNLIVTSMLFVCAAIFAQIIELSAFFYWIALFSDFGLHFLLAGSARIDKCFQKTMCRCTEKMFPKSIDNWPPLNTPLLVERLELFIILCLGESVAGADPTGRLSNNAANISQVLLGITFVCCIKFLTIDFGEHPSQLKMSKLEPHHALNSSRGRGTCWVVMHVPMGLGILISAAAVESGVKSLEAAPPELPDGYGLTRWRRWAFAIGLFCVTLASTVAQALHKGKHGGSSRRCKKETRTSLRLAMCLMVLILPILFEDGPTFSDQIWFLFCMLLLLVIMLVGDRYGRSKMAVKHTDEQNQEILQDVQDVQDGDETDTDPSH